MSIPNSTVGKVRPTHPGEMLREDFLPDYRLSVSSFAKALGVSRQIVNEFCENGVPLVRKWRCVSPVCLVTRRNFG